MRDVLPEIRKWRTEGKRIAVATVVKAWGSSPRPIGSRMAVTDAGDMIGSVSGGCVEGAVFEEAQGVLESGVPKLVSYGVTTDVAWSVGLSCGGEIEVFVEPYASSDGGGAIDERTERRVSLFPELGRAVERSELTALATIVDESRIFPKLRESEAVARACKALAFRQAVPGAIEFLMGKDMERKIAKEVGRRVAGKALRR